MTCKYSGADWVQDDYNAVGKATKTVPRKLSPIGAKVADILGQVFCGIYHIQNDILRADLSDKLWVSMTIRAYGGLSTFDDDVLTRLVVLCHDAGVRMQIEPCNPRYVRLKFWQRNGRTGSICDRMPTIEDHVRFIHEALTCKEVVLQEEKSNDSL